MNIQEIRVSGLLEQYVIGALSHKEEALVLQTLQDFPQLKQDIDHITEILRAYNRLELKEIPVDLKDQVVNAFNHAQASSTSKRGYIKPKSSKSKSSNRPDVDVPWSIILGSLAALLAIACGILYFTLNGKAAGLKNEIVSKRCSFGVSSWRKKDIRPSLLDFTTLFLNVSCDAIHFSI